ncbi:MAG: protein translocase subunit SecF [Bacteroidetes bacterium]|nr:protein translocase subunit SecF [Bacteroidota bacterium]
MRLFKKTNIDFLNVRRICYLISSSLILIGIITMFVKGLSFGIDFKGGTEIVLAFQERIEVSDIRTALTKVQLGNSEIKYYGTDNYVLINTGEQAEGTTIADHIKSAVQASMPDKAFEVVKEDKIGPKIGKELRTDALYAIIWAFAAILAYIAIRFKFAYGLGAVLALIHDVLITLGFLTILNGLIPGLNLDISQEIIAAFLTLIGVSVNDTVVVFDRMRENQKIYRSMSLGEIMRKSLNETLSRTLITSLTIFLVLVVLLVFGGEVNRGFAFTMAFGIITGTYSSIFVASAFVLDWTQYKNRKKAAA